MTVIWRPPVCLRRRARAASTVKRRAKISGEMNNMGFGMPAEIATVRVDTFKECIPNVT